MPNYPETPEDWAPYNEEIRSLYIDQKWTLQATMQHMKQKHNFRGTVRQYKARFGGEKKIPAPKWVTLGRHIRKRKLDGKDTDLYRFGRQVTPERLLRGLDRYTRWTQHGDTPTNLPLLGPDFDLRTPPPSSPALASVPLPFSDYDFSWFQGDAYDIGITCNLDRAQWTMDLPTLGVRHALLAIMESLRHPCRSMFVIPSSIPRGPPVPWLIDVADSIINSASANERTVAPPLGSSEHCSFVDILHYCAFRLSNRMLLERRYLKALLDEDHVNFFRTLLSTQSETLSSFTTQLLEEMIDSRESGFGLGKIKPLCDIIVWILTALLRPGALSHHQISAFLRRTWNGGRAASTIIQTVVAMAEFSPLHLKEALEAALRSRNWDLANSLMDAGAKLPPNWALEVEFPRWQKSVGPKSKKVLLRLLSLVDNPKHVFETEDGLSLSNSQWCALAFPDIYTELPQKWHPQRPDLAAVAFAAHRDADAVSRLLVDSPWLAVQAESLLLLACSNGMLEITRNLLQAGINADAPSLRINGFRRRKPLGEAVANVSRDGSKIISLLLHHGADVSSIDSRDLCRQLTAVKSRRDTTTRRKLSKVFRMHLESEMGRESLRRSGSHFLCLAAALNDIVFLGWLLCSGVDVNAEVPEDWWPETAFRTAIRLGNFKATRFLARNGANLTNAGGTTAGLTELQLACEAGASPDRSKIIALLLKRGALPNRPRPYSALENESALGRVVRYHVRGNPFKDVKLLIRSGAEVNRPDLCSIYNQYLTPFQRACTRGDMALVRYMEGSGGDVLKPAHLGGGRSALQCAAESGHLEVVKYLLEKGADVNEAAALYEGRTALQAASETGQFEIVLWLLRVGADVNAPGALEGGKTALEAAEGKVDMVALLRNAGAVDIDVANGNIGLNMADDADVV